MWLVVAQHSFNLKCKPESFWQDSINNFHVFTFIEQSVAQIFSSESFLQHEYGIFAIENTFFKVYGSPRVTWHLVNKCLIDSSEMSISKNMPFHSQSFHNKHSVRRTSFTAPSPDNTDMKRFDPAITGNTLPKATTAVACLWSSCKLITPGSMSMGPIPGGPPIPNCVGGCGGGTPKGTAPSAGTIG